MKKLSLLLLVAALTTAGAMSAKISADAAARGMIDPDMTVGMSSENKAKPWFLPGNVSPEEVKKFEDGLEKIEKKMQSRMDAHKKRFEKKMAEVTRLLNLSKETAKKVAEKPELKAFAEEMTVFFEAKKAKMEKNKARWEQLKEKWEQKKADWIQKHEDMMAMDDVTEMKQ